MMMMMIDDDDDDDDDDARLPWTESHNKRSAFVTKQKRLQ